MRLGEQVFELVMGGKPGDEKNKLGLLLFFAIGFVLLVLFALVVVWVDGSQNAAGPLGDFFGGMLNPVLSFLAFAGVLYSIHLQRIDLRETQQETQRQQFEATFFQMLAQHNRIVDAMDIKNSDHAQISGGRDCFKHFLHVLETRIRAHIRADGTETLNSIKAGYEEFWEHNRQDLGHYYRFLYNYIRYVDEANLPRLAFDKVEPKIKYMRIIRAQLSDYELALMFYNALCYNGKKFKEYVRLYDLLDNLPTGLIRPEDHLQFRVGMGRVGKLELL